MVAITCALLTACNGSGSPSGGIGPDSSLSGGNGGGSGANGGLNPPATLAAEFAPPTNNQLPAELQPPG
jgi:hypothetical protein